MAGIVRQKIDQTALENYLRENVPEIATPIELKQFKHGQSNPTYQITAADGQRFVLRKRPPGQQISAQAHRVDREYRVLAALHGHTDVPVPRPYAMCSDPSVLGTPFYVMEFLDGRVFADVGVPGVSPEERTAIWREAAAVLARLHAVDPRDVGLEGFGRPDGFYGRQIRSFDAICAGQSKVVDGRTGRPLGPLPYYEECVRFFRDPSVQPRDRSCLVHGDYRIDNLVFHKTEPRVIGVLDLFTFFYMARHPGASPYDLTSLLPGRTPGMPQPEQVVAWYARCGGYDPTPDVDFGIAFGAWKTAVLAQGIEARMVTGQAGSEQVAAYAAIKNPMAELAWQLTQYCSSGWQQAARL
ncbi:Phosphotransferase enzyme family domain protein [Cordyceps fumosorosea ARSEF 2679]|uniref:Phosphotransferase enzyme family domain protein n=1 Tax=Cordyceps fumosorosea (strain ARSEF 2679) TaxID=1081104 RepID=A0A162JT22_CORFA|nr:Phosphotransferase enzyme family domain protein [Cordyceps fumosorosea ARSEF 2679]OAA73362.1 Phosphotransferase enzyme family domain protein [Cordyceps fumosorosea ARSEF 2679]